MTASLGERALLAIEALILPLRTANGYATESGSNVLVSPVYAEMEDGEDWETLIYVANEVYSVAANNDTPTAIAGNMRTYWKTLTINIDVHTRIDAQRAAVQIEQIKDDVQGAMLPVSGVLMLDSVRVGSLSYIGNTLITDLLGAGVIGSRAQVLVRAQQTITH